MKKLVICYMRYIQHFMEKLLVHDIFQKPLHQQNPGQPKSPVVLAIWASPSGFLTSRTPSCDDVRCSRVLYPTYCEADEC